MLKNFRANVLKPIKNFMYYAIVTVLVKVLQLFQNERSVLKGISQLANDYFSTLNFLVRRCR